MYESGKVLQHDADFDDAIIHRLPIKIVQSETGEVLDNRAYIGEHTEDAVVLLSDGNAYLKSTNDFVVI
ncbi:hypothetical protein [Paenibacillus koleovorans]|uniref:hypothetical protein n=1 Tax=Paenibacillus koleovorans TaxID=121608 RepID=UPI000FDAD6FB|nr:hypothetical protein [Paenibacillus koleovorans]